MPGWNFADVWEVVAEQIPDAQAQVHGDRRVTWAEFDRRPTASPPRCSTGARPSRTRWPSTSTTAPSTSSRCSARSRPGWCRSTPTTGTRTTSSSTCGTTRTAWRSCSTARSPSTIERIRDRVPKVTTWLWVDDGDGLCPEWAMPYEEAANSHAERVVAPWGRSGDQLLMTYTGGTTGMPKGVMWRQDDLFRNLVGQMNPLVRSAEASAETVRQMVTVAGPVGMPACPLMHGTGLYTQLIILSLGRQLGHARVAEVRRRRDVRDDRARAGEPDRHRGRRLRQAHAQGARRQPRRVGSGQPVPGGVVGRHVQRARQAGPPEAPSRA